MSYWDEGSTPRKWYVRCETYILRALDDENSHLWTLLIVVGIILFAAFVALSWGAQ